MHKFVACAGEVPPQGTIIAHQFRSLRSSGRLRSKDPIDPPQYHHKGIMATMQINVVHHSLSVERSCALAAVLDSGLPNTFGGCPIPPFFFVFFCFPISMLAVELFFEKETRGPWGTVPQVMLTTGSKTTASTLPRNASILHRNALCCPPAVGTRLNCSKSRIRFYHLPEYS